MNYGIDTLKYYANFIGLSYDRIMNASDGIHFVRNHVLDEALTGYSCPIDIYIFRQDGKIFISYSQKGENTIAMLRNENDIYRLIENNKMKYKYFFDGKNESSSAVPMKLTDFEYYKAFFSACNPGCKNLDWLYEYYSEITNKEQCFGIFEKNILVCASDSPSVPFFKESIAEIGINTLKEYRHKGYAKEVCKAHINSLIQRKMVPIWSTERENAASQRLALSLGFKVLAEVSEIT